MGLGPSSSHGPCCHPQHTFTSSCHCPCIDGVMPQSATIRIEDLGQPIQGLIRDMLAQGKADESLIKYIHVKDVARVFEGRSLGLQVCLQLQGQFPCATNAIFGGVPASINAQQARQI